MMLQTEVIIFTAWTNSNWIPLLKNGLISQTLVFLEEDTNRTKQAAKVSDASLIFFSPR